MAVLSTKDKLVLRVSAQKVERWNRERAKPAENVSRCKGVVFAPGQEKESLNYSDKAVVLSANDKTRMSADKIAAGLRLDGKDKYRGKEGEYDHPSHVIKGTTSGRGARGK